MKKDCLIGQSNLKHISGIVRTNHDGKYKVKDNWLGLPTQTLKLIKKLSGCQDKHKKGIMDMYMNHTLTYTCTCMN